MDCPPCGGEDPPPRFSLPPPPAPSCGLSPGQCTLDPVESEYVQGSVAPVPLVAAGCSALLMALLVAALLLWRHRRKEAGAPSKPALSPRGGSTARAPPPSGPYDDSWVHYHPARVPPPPPPPLEMLDVKYRPPPVATLPQHTLPHLRPQQGYDLQFERRPYDLSPMDDGSDGTSSVASSSSSGGLFRRHKPPYTAVPAIYNPPWPAAAAFSTFRPSENIYATIDDISSQPPVHLLDNGPFCDNNNPPR